MSVTYVTSKGETVIATMSDSDAAALVREFGRGEFARSLVQHYQRVGLTRKQLPYLHKLANDIVAAQMRAASAPVVADVPVVRDTFALSIVTMMQRAQSVVRFPKVRFDTAHGRIQFSIAGSASRYAGCVMVTDGGRYGSNVFYGRITTDGEFVASRTCDPHVLAELRMIAQNPAGYAAAYGRRTGSCCFCRRELTDARSVTVGYGPICAENFGLPWGERVESTAQAIALAVA